MGMHGMAKEPGRTPAVISPSVARLSLITGIIFAVLGVLSIVRGLSGYDLTDIVMGLVYCLLVPGGLFGWLSYPRGLRKHGWRYRSMWAFGLAALALEGLVAWSMWLGYNPVVQQFLVPGVTAAQLVAQPILYNQQPVRISAPVSANGRRCSIPLDDPGVATAGARSGPMILLISHSKRCDAARVRPFMASISGTFRAFRDPAFLDSPWVLEDAHITPLDGIGD